jgi:Na+/serine symporter
MNNLVTITIVGLTAGIVITITSPPAAAIVMVLGVATVWCVGYFTNKKAGG